MKPDLEMVLSIKTTFKSKSVSIIILKQESKVQKSGETNFRFRLRLMLS